ncbi:MAG: type II secretion system protein GspJ [Leptospirillia bacterium]
MIHSRNHRGSSARGAAGFTLLEVLVAIGILAVLMTMLYSSFDQTSRLTGHVDEASEQYRTARLVLAKMSNELASTFFFPEDSDVRFSGTDGVSEAGEDADEIEFTSLSGLLLEDGPGSEMNLLTYRLEGDSLMQAETFNPLGSGVGNTRTFPLGSGLSGFRLRYMNSDKDWVDGWGGDGAGVPLAVEVTLLFPRNLDEDSQVEDRFLPFTTVVRIPMAEA